MRERERCSWSPRESALASGLYLLGEPEPSLGWVASGLTEAGLVGGPSPPHLMLCRDRSTMVAAFSKYKTRPSGSTGVAGTLGKKNQHGDSSEKSGRKNDIPPCIHLPVLEELLWEGELGKGFNGRCASLPRAAVDFFHGQLSIFPFCSISILVTQLKFSLAGGLSLLLSLTSQSTLLGK